MEKTLIQLQKSTAMKLHALRTVPRQTYDEVINRLLRETDAEPLTQEEIKDIEVGLADIKAGRVHSLKNVARDLGVKL